MLRGWIGSLRVQVLVAGAVLWAALFAGAVWATGHVLRRALERSVSGHLLASAAFLADEAGPLLPRQAEIEPGSLADARLRSVLGQAVAGGLAKDVALLDARGLVLFDATGESAPGFPATDLGPDAWKRLGAGQGLALAPRRGEFGQWTQSVYVPLGAGAALRLDADPRQLQVLDAWRRVSLAVGLAGLVLCGLLGLLAAGWVLRPVRWMAEAARAADGGAGASLPPVRGDELGRAARDLAASLGKLESERLETRLRREMAERRARDMDQVARAIAHEVRNPLAVIRGQAELLLRKSPDPADGALLNRVVEQVDQLDQVVGRFLELGRAPRLARRSVDAAGLVRGLVASLRTLKPGEAWTVVDGGAPVAAVQGDPALLEGALLNLGLNALQAMPEGGAVRIAASLSGRSLCIEVSDDGPGLDSAARERLFEPFFTTKALGNGLGLALARRAAEVHGGELRLLESERGARFGFFLPLDNGDA